MKLLRFKYNDGGRAKAGIPGRSGDCVIRAIAIAERIPYKKARKIVQNFIAQDWAVYGLTPSKKYATGMHGVYNTSILLKSLGYKFVPTPGKCFRAYQEIPRGRIIVFVSSHVAAVINQELRDTWNSQKTGIRPMRGYWIKL
jgi:hypothetical protein